MTTHGDRTATDRDERAGAAICEPAAQLFVVLRADELTAPPSRHALSHIDVVRLGRGDDYAAERSVEAGERCLALRLPDPRMSKQHAELRRTSGGWQLRDLGSSNGSRVDGARTREAALADGAFLELGHTLLRLRTALPTPARASGDLTLAELADRPQALRTLLPELSLSFERLSRVARSKVSVLVLGETGTGKEWLARAIHEHSGRAGAFVALNCGALPAGLVESLLFGHVRGAFSGAHKDELGYVRAASGGSLCLDEVGDLPLASQAALLRVLQESEVIPVGATRPTPVDLRVLAATHAPLAEMAERGEFRNDLFARLSGFTFRAPPLRERIEDLGLIVRTLLPELEEAAGGRLSLHPEAARLLVSYAWPRNLRELRQGLLAAAVLAEGRVIEPAHLPTELRERGAEPAAAPSGADAPGDEHLQRELHRLFVEHRGNVSRVARELGKARVQVQRWMKRFGIDPAKFR